MKHLVPYAKTRLPDRSAVQLEGDASKMSSKAEGGVNSEKEIGLNSESSDLLISEDISETEIGEEFLEITKAGIDFKENVDVKPGESKKSVSIDENVEVKNISISAIDRADRKDAKGKADERHIECMSHRPIQSFKDDAVGERHTPKSKERDGVKGQLIADGIKYVRLDRIVRDDKKTVEHLSQLLFQAIANKEGEFLLEKNPSINLQKLLSKEHSFDSLKLAQLKNIKETIEEFQLEDFEFDSFRASLSNQNITNDERDAYIQYKMNAYDRQDSDIFKKLISE